MKQLSLSIPHVIVMVGLPGSGKSFFAEHFAETFSAPLISYDKIRDELFNEPTFSRDEDEIIGRMADAMLAEITKTKSTLVYEGDSKSRTSRTELAKKIRAAGYQPLFVWVQIDEATAKTRSLKAGMPAEAYRASLKKFTPLNPSEPSVVISGKHTYASQLKIVLRKLSSARTVAPNHRPIATKPRQSESVRRIKMQ